MKAIVVERAGGPEVLQVAEVPRPRIERDDQVLVQVRAVGVNPIDYKMRGALDRFPVTRPAILGCDGAGVIVEVGSGVERFKPGDEVYFCQPGFNGRQGTYAEYAVVDEALVAFKPKSLDFVHAAAAPLVTITAWESLYDRVQLQNGQTVLIPGGAGGVGHIAIQLARIAGAKVVTSVSTDEKARFVAELGADHVIRYRDEDMVEAVQRWTDGKGVDVAFDTLGDGVFCQCCEAAKVYGELVTILLPPQDVDWTPARVRNLRISLEMMLTPVLLELPEWEKHQGHILASAAELFDQGRLKVQMARTFPLEEAAAAQEYLEKQHPIGKVVLVHDQ
ncbi:MAG TPA: alcohol dehydrogenase [Methylothermaceae bacterium]|nr:alcohol dehydrogenase [Methylothermaceae bacterium]